MFAIPNSILPEAMLNEAPVVAGVALACAKSCVDYARSQQLPRENSSRSSLLLADGANKKEDLKAKSMT